MRRTALTLGLVLAVSTVVVGASRASEGPDAASSPRVADRSAIACDPAVVRQIAMAAITTAP